ncbi:nuclear transport factor 2 family protein [Thermodesulfobacteriota bacterium]
MKRNRTMTRISACLLICGLIVIWGSSVFGEEWNEEQKEIIKAIEARSEILKKGDLEATMAGLHKDSLIWWTQDAYPFEKDLAKFRYGGWFRSNKPKSYKTEVLNIQIFGNVAIVYSRYEWEGTTPGVRSGRGMSVRVKQGNEWKLMGTMSAGCDKPVFCPLK